VARKPVLEGVFAEKVSDQCSIATLKARTGPLLQHSFRVKDKEMVITLSKEGSNSLAPTSFEYTLWLSFRQPVNKSISESISKALSEG
jgi:hypothetical protein